MNVELRKPTAEEKKDLVSYLCNEEEIANPSDMELADKEAFVEQAAIAVFDHYVTDSPGYAGKLMMVVWSGSPGVHEVFVWQGHRIEKVEKELA